MYPFGWTSRALASAKRWSGYVVPFPKWRREIMIKNGMSTVSHFSCPPSPFWPSWSWWVHWTLYLFHLFKNAFQHHDDYDNGQWRSWRSLPARIWRCYCCCCWRTLGGGERKPKRAKSGVGGGIVVVVGIVSRGPWRLPRVVTRVSKGYHMIDGWGYLHHHCAGWLSNVVAAMMVGTNGPSAKQMEAQLLRWWYWQPTTVTLLPGGAAAAAGFRRVERSGCGIIQRRAAW